MHFYPEEIDDFLRWVYQPSKADQPGTGVSQVYRWCPTTDHVGAITSALCCFGLLLQIKKVAYTQG